jgi:hypothetical protein
VNITCDPFGQAGGQVGLAALDRGGRVDRVGDPAASSTALVAARS